MQLGLKDDQQILLVNTDQRPTTQTIPLNENYNITDRAQTALVSVKTMRQSLLAKDNLAPLNLTRKSNPSAAASGDAAANRNRASRFEDI